MEGPGYQQEVEGALPAPPQLGEAALHVKAPPQPQGLFLALQGHPFAFLALRLNFTCIDQRYLVELFVLMEVFSLCSFQ